MDVAVVILNWNGREYLETYLPSIIQHSTSVRLILADNASTDDSLEFVERTYPQIEVIRNKTNAGFAEGYNLALEQIQADIFVLLNSDIEVTAGWIEPILNRFKSDESIVACQPKILALLEKNRFERAGAAGGFIDKDGFPFCRGRIFDHAELDEGQYNESSEIFWATGACLFIRAEAFKTASGFDSDFFAHMEEIDLCWRLKRHGYRIWYEARSTVYHLGGGTLNYMSTHKTFLNFRNNLYMLHKNYPGMLFPKIYKRLLMDGLAAGKFLTSLQFGHFWAVVRAHSSYYGKLGSLNRKRRQLKAESKVNAISMVYPRSVVVRYFFGGIKKFSDLGWKP